jgi:hypothetical protein
VGAQHEALNCVLPQPWAKYEHPFHFNLNFSEIRPIAKKTRQQKKQSSRCEK